ncbi:hypothetical protein OG401_41470 [Kitasatospora purpeofusca]|uniref:hypothetical protein n=1 Tax=Kitasatospora purpeofusca TaxID=67352 RepID=UPI0022529DE6|nr:hypothetical protein [Kitasatospora purpeofusca]MCX4690692.1 hypothetical protein [Kitasatospora purpeofusca]
MSRPGWVKRIFAIDSNLGRDEPDLALVFLLGDIGIRFCERIDAIPRDSRREILEIAEEVLASGGEVDQAAIATGFVEEILKAWDEGFDLESVWEFVGPKCRAYCLEWNNFSGVTSPAWMQS